MPVSLDPVQRTTGPLRDKTPMASRQRLIVARRRLGTLAAILEESGQPGPAVAAHNIAELLDVDPPTAFIAAWEGEP